jgi:small-conductance mechanosensitive channel
VTNTQYTTNLSGLPNLAEAGAIKPPVEFWDPHNLSDPGTWLGAILLAFIFIVVAWIAGRAVRLAIHRFLDRTAKAGVDPTGIRFLGQLANVGVYIFTFLIYSHIVPALHNLGTAWLTSMGVLSVVLGLAAQSTLGNFISGVSLVLYRPFRLGDRLQVACPTGTEIGTVENINLGYTVLRTADERRLVIPNNTIASQATVNLSSIRKGAACNVTITLAASADVAPARKILVDLAQAHVKTISIEGCNVTAVSGIGTTITLSVWCVNDDTVTPLRSDLLEGAKKQFDAAGIKMARWTQPLK